MCEHRVLAGRRCQTAGSAERRTSCSSVIPPLSDICRRQCHYLLTIVARVAPRAKCKPRKTRSSYQICRFKRLRAAVLRVDPGARPRPDEANFDAYAILPGPRLQVASQSLSGGGRFSNPGAGRSVSSKVFAVSVPAINRSGRTRQPPTLHVERPGPPPGDLAKSPTSLLLTHCWVRRQAASPEWRYRGG